MINYFKNIIPYGIVKLYNQRISNHKKVFVTNKLNDLNKNNIFFNKHQGDRCFLIGTGSSINNQNLKNLKNEIIFSLSRFYYHFDYNFLVPKYQVFSGLNMHNLNSSICDSFYYEYSQKCISDYYFCDYSDKDNILKINNKNFKDKICYYSANLPFSYLLDNKIDLTKPICAYQNIFILSIQIAIYMGFKEIYLLGADHDWILKYYTNETLHFYDKLDVASNKFYNNNTWKKHENIFPILESYYKKWQHYISLKNYAEANHIKIYNATDGGMLDVFQRVSFQDIKFK